MLLVGNGLLITRDAKNTVIEDGCVAVKDQLIVETGATGDLKAKYKEAEFIDAEKS